MIRYHRKKWSTWTCIIYLITHQKRHDLQAEIRCNFECEGVYGRIKVACSFLFLAWRFHVSHVRLDALQEQAYLTQQIEVQQLGGATVGGPWHHGIPWLPHNVLPGKPTTTRERLPSWLLRRHPVLEGDGNLEDFGFRSSQLCQSPNWGSWHHSFTVLTSAKMAVV